MLHLSRWQVVSKGLTKNKVFEFSNKQVWLDAWRHQKRFQGFLNSMDLILNLIQGQSTILCLKKEAMWLQVKEILCNQLIRNINLTRSFLFWLRKKKMLENPLFAEELGLPISKNSRTPYFQCNIFKWS